MLGLVDDRLRALERQVIAAPDDGPTRALLRAALDRLAPLGELARWDRADPAAQDVVLASVARLLGPAFELLGAASHAAGGERHRVGAFRHVATGLVLQLVPGGELHMGSARGPASERPMHRVRVPPLLIGRYPVLQAEWDRVAGALGVEDERVWEGPSFPIEGVTWHAARRWLEGVGLRLPSEAEWEWAARAGTTTDYFWGDRMDDACCWYGAPAELWTTHPPAEHASRGNAFGLVDPSGNVAEWCEDAWGPYTEGPRDAAPREPAARSAGRLRVLRGGDGFSLAVACRSAARAHAAATDHGGGIGLRAARSLPV